ncbi:MAG: MATE family efflux transporter [Clostridiales bacterium]|nr:MATE family efflux transporter [Clostridiales bacterium]
MTLNLKKYIGDAAFYKMVLFITLPIMLQNALTSVVGLLDNVMVGQMGTNEMTGVSVANNLLFVYLIICFGAVSGAGIFSAQFFGKGDHKGMAAAFRMKLYICVVITLISILIFLYFGKDLISLYMHESDDQIGDVVAASKASWNYLLIMLAGLPFLGISMCYSSTVRECGVTVPPMIAGIISVLVDLVLNYLLIFGKFGFPELGVQGAAIATVISRVTDCTINVVYTHIRAGRFLFIKHAYKTFKVSVSLLKSITFKGLPLVINEGLWVLSITVASQCYSRRGISAVAALSIDSSISNVFNIFFIAMGSAVAIIVGQMLGANKIEEAKETTRKLVFTTFVICVATSLVMACCSGFFPEFYQTEPEVKSIAIKLILVHSCFIPFYGICNSAYFAIRSGGKTWLTFIFDSGIQWVLFVPIAYLLSHLTDLNVILLFACANCSDILKTLIALVFLKKIRWAQNIVESK